LKIIALAGHYGSGKTQLAVNLALKSQKEAGDALVCDLDIVNPYFRTIDCREVLIKAGIPLISSEYAGSNAEMPGLPPGAAAIFDREEGLAIVDVGGDERGALVLGRWAERLRAQAEMLLVVNMYRPLSATPPSAMEIVQEIEEAARVRFTGMINNSNLGPDTTAQDICQSDLYARDIAQTLGLPIRYTSVRRDLAPALAGQIENLLPIEIFTKPEWKI